MKYVVQLAPGAWLHRSTIHNTLSGFSYKYPLPVITRLNWAAVKYERVEDAVYDVKIAKWWWPECDPKIVEVNE